MTNRLLLCGVIGALALTACGDDAKPAATPTPSTSTTSASPSSSVSVAPVVLDPAMVDFCELLLIAEIRAAAGTDRGPSAQLMANGPVGDPGCLVKATDPQTGDQLDIGGFFAFATTTAAFDQERADEKANVAKAKAQGRAVEFRDETGLGVPAYSTTESLAGQGSASVHFIARGLAWTLNLSGPDYEDEKAKRDALVAMAGPLLQRINAL